MDDGDDSRKSRVGRVRWDAGGGQADNSEVL